MKAWLYGITPESLLSDEPALFEAVDAALEGGMTRLQYRAKRLPAAQKQRQAAELRRLCREYGARFIVNDDIELARSVQADGVHLGRDDAAIADARRLLGSDALIGASCYNRLDLAVRALEQGADHVAFGRFYPSRSKPDAVQADPGLLAEARQALDCPICAIGGITPANARPLVAQGADLLAVIEGLFSARDIRARACQFLQAWA